MTEELIDDQIETGTDADPAPEAPATPSPDDAVKAMKAELAATRARLAEVENSERIWAEKARKAAPAPEAPKPEISGPELLDLIEKEGVAGLKKLGFVSASEVEAITEKVAGTVRSESTIYSEFPELKDANGAFYKAVNETLSSPDFADVQGPGAIRLAAKQVRKQMEGSTQRKSDIDERLRAQSGVRDSAPSAPPSKGVTATAEQLEFAARMGITPKQLTEQLRSAQ